MNKFLTLTDEQRLTVFKETSARVCLPILAVEKDFWVTEVLNILFTLPYADKMVFKGGTSLSKIWGVIHRFSEDIDIAMDRSLFGVQGDVTKKQLKKLRKLSSVFVRDVLSKDLETAAKAAGLDRFIEIFPDPDGEGDYTYPEPRKIHVYYKSLFEKSSVSYLRDEIQLEVGARSLLEPTVSARISSFVGQQFPDIVRSDAEVEVIAATAYKTFLEKAFLLHELFSTDGCRNANRKSRHLYDLYRMLETGIAEDAIGNDTLWETIRHHREIFTSVRDVDYTRDIRKTICLTPPKDVIEMWKADYDTMVLNMIYDDTKPTFEDILDSIREIERMFGKR